MILDCLTTLESTDANINLRDTIEETPSADPSQCGQGTLSIAGASIDGEQTRSLNMSRRKRTKSSHSFHDDSLSLTAFSTKQNRNDFNVQWFVLVCSSIKRLVEYVPLSTDNISRCTCLQLALVATKPVTIDHPDW